MATTALGKAPVGMNADLQVFGWSWPVPLG
jgi:hypothetical protein